MNANTCVVIYVICMLFTKPRADMDLLWQMVTALVILATSGYVECQTPSAQEPNCNNNSTCPCCSVKCPSDGSGQCGGNCKDGYHSGKCWNICPDNCIRCVDAQQGGGVSNCTLCRDGYYSTTSQYQCQSACPSNCKTCVSASYCTSCQDGYYLSESFQCTACNETCSACTSYSYCTSCRIGHFLDGRSGICHKCNPLCLHCNSSQTCYCSNGCTIGVSNPNFNCRTDTNDCTFGCKVNFTSSDGRYKCDKCRDGNYGIHCDSNCYHTCNSFGCDRSNGVCFACRDGLFGNYCNMTCPENCRSGCDKTTGQCASCKDGFFGRQCTLVCVTNCNKCTLVNGSCILCADGFFGHNCVKKCQENCLNRKCNMDNGSCLCGPGYMGSVCENKITTTNKEGIGPPLVVSATSQNYVGATVGITLTAVVIVAGLVGLGVWCFRNRINGAGRGNFPVFGMTVNMSDIDKLEGQLSRIDKELNKWTSHRAEVASKLEGLKANIPYRNTDRADKVEDQSYEMLQKGHSESPYSSIQ